MLNEQERKRKQRETARTGGGRGRLTASGTVCRARAGLRLRDSQQDSKLAGRKDRISASTYRPCMGACHITHTQTHTYTRILQACTEVGSLRVGLDFDLAPST